MLRRLMRRAIVQGRRIDIEPGFLTRYADVVRELMASAYPELHEHADTIRMWLGREEEQFGRTLEQGMRLLDDIVARAKDAGEEGIGADQAFLLHDTYGFPFDLTLELAAERGLGVDEQGFEELMERAARARPRGRRPRRARRGARADRRLRRGLRRDHLHRLRDDRAGDRGRVDRAGERARAGQARRVAVLRHRRRPGRRRRRDRVRGRRLRCARARRRARRRRPGARAGADQGRAARGRARRRARGPRAPPDRAQPHRHPPAARGAARRARHPRAPGGLLRGPRQAALRLHARRADDRRARSAPSRTRSTARSSPTIPCGR